MRKQYKNRLVLSLQFSYDSPMPRRKQQQNIEVFPVLILLLFGLGFGIYNSQANLVIITSVLFIVASLIGLAIFLIDRAKKEKLRQSGIAEIDLMSGLDFERYLQLLLIQKGFTNVSLTTTYDLGVDLIAHKDGHAWAIQAKRYKGTVGLDSVRQVVAAMKHYKCDKAMVITNSYFTKNAQVIAASTNCLLIDRDSLINLILKK